MVEIYLQPGEIYFAGADTRIRTLLGSCVALSLWHPQSLIGGLCHIMLPANQRRSPQQVDARYADQAFELMMREITKAKTRPEQYQAKLFGGGNMFPEAQARCSGINVSQKNIDACRALAERYGLRVVAEDLGGFRSRYVIFDIATGQAWIRRGEVNRFQNGSEAR